MFTSVFTVFLFASICLGENLDDDFSGGHSSDVISNLTGKITEPRVRFSNQSKRKINICCQTGEVWDEMECLANPKLSWDSLILPTNQIYNTSDEYLLTLFEVHHHNPCNDRFEFEEPKISIEDEVNARNSTEFCLANVMNGYKIFTLLIVCKWDENWVNVISKISLTVHVIFLFLSILSLTATFLTYALLPELKNNRGIILMCYITCICVINCMNIINELGVDLLRKFPTACTFIGTISYFFFLAKFFWLNVMCFDIWGTFKNIRSARSEGTNFKRVMIHSVYAWGCPLALTVFCFILEFHDGVPIKLIKHYGPWNRCWLGFKEGLILIQFLPTTSIMFCNFYLFLRTTWKIRGEKKEISKLSSEFESRSSEENRHWFHLYSKLFIVMGIFWPFYIIPWYDIARWLTHLIILFNDLQGTIIFIIFVLNERVKKMLSKKFNRSN